MNNPKPAFFHLVVLIAYGLLLHGCSSYSGSGEKSSSATSQGIPYQEAEDQWPDNLTFNITALDTTRAPESGTSHGLKIKTEVEVPTQLLDSLTQPSDINALFLDLEYKNEEITFKSHRKKLTQTDSPIAAGTDTPVITNAGKHLFIYHIPYRKLKLPSGEQDIKISFRLYTTQLKAFRTSSHYKTIDNISKKALFERKLTVTTQFPPLTKIKISNLHFKLDPDKKAYRKYDFNVGGPGHPDLLWELRTGKETLFTSETRRNQTQWKTNGNKLVLLMSKHDPLTLIIKDADKAVNRADKIGEETRSVNAWVNRETFSPFGNLKTFSIQVTPINQD